MIFVGFVSGPCIFYAQQSTCTSLKQLCKDFKGDLTETIKI